MQTLLIIDMQTAWLEENPRHDAQAVIQRINQVAQYFRQTNQPIIFVRHDDDVVKKGSQEWQVTPAITAMSTDLFVDKTACDSFSGTDLAQRLQEIGTTEVVICGLATEFCVDTTLRACLSRGYKVTALADTHTTSNRPHLDAASIIVHHNWIWTHMAAPEGVSVKVATAADFLAAQKLSDLPVKGSAH